MKQHQAELSIQTRPDSMQNISAAIEQVVRDSHVTTGLCVAFIRHTSASLVIQENADPAVIRDLTRWMKDLAPEKRAWEHQDEGPDDMPSHARSAITHCSLSIPIVDGALAVGTWQGIYLWEHRGHAHTRSVIVHIVGE